MSVRRAVSPHYYYRMPPSGVGVKVFKVVKVVKDFKVADAFLKIRTPRSRQSYRLRVSVLSEVIPILSVVFSGRATEVRDCVVGL